MKILLLGSGKYYINNNDIRCYPPSIKSEFQALLTSSNEITHLDIDETVEPDIIADVTKNKWWTATSDKYDIIIDTISHIGPHTRARTYVNLFKEGVKHLLVKDVGIFHGFYPLD